MLDQSKFGIVNNRIKMVHDDIKQRLAEMGAITEKPPNTGFRRIPDRTP